MLIMTAVTVTGTPSPAHRSRAAMTVRQLPGPRKASCSPSVGRSSENSTLWNRRTAASPRSSMLLPLEVMLQRTWRSARSARMASYSGWSPFSPTPRFRERTGIESQTRLTSASDSRSTTMSGR